MTADGANPEPAALDLFRLDGKVALVTGASRGLGAAMAEALASAGADIALHGYESPAQTAARLAGRRTGVFTGDFADPGAADRLVAETLAEFGRIDILVNNAGTIRRAPAALHSDEDWDAVIAVNLSSVFRL